MVYRYACGLDACGLDIILRLNFVTFFRILNLVIFSVLNTIKVGKYWVFCVRNSSCSFMPIFFKLYRCLVMVLRCACGLNIYLRSIIFFIDSSYS